MSSIPPIGSNGMNELFLNAANLDKAMHSDANIWTDRFGVQRITYSYMERNVTDLINNISGPLGSDKIGHGDVTVKRVLDVKKFIPYFAAVLDYGPVINAVISSLPYGSSIILEGERYRFSTTIKRRAGVHIEGVGQYATELYWENTDLATPAIMYEKVLLKSRNDAIIGNNTGQYHTSIKKLTLLGANNKGIGLHRGEAWWDNLEELIIEGFDIAQQDGIGTTDVTGCYWCHTKSVWYRKNRINLRITDFSNLNIWTSCRFSHATEWDIEFVEPTLPLSLGMQGIRFTDCEFASPNSVSIGARIFDLNFHNPYFEQPGIAVIDSSTHTKGNVSFTGTPKFFGGKSISNKVIAGYQGQCTNWTFENIKTNLGKTAETPGPLYLIDMGPKAFYFDVKGHTHTGTEDWELTQVENFSRKKLQLYSVDGKSILYTKRISSEELISKVSRYPVLLDVDTNLGGEKVIFGKKLDLLGMTKVPCLEIHNFATTYVYCYAHINIKISGVDTAGSFIKNAHIQFDISSNSGTLGTIVEGFNNQTGTRIVVRYECIKSGNNLVLNLWAENTVTEFDQVNAIFEITTLGRFVGKTKPS
ncbi:tail spike protein with pectin-lyase like hydrolase [Aeromonas phage AerS_266]|nr:tail spike protein with pectin-lyase like hydrolase [Aeromonas phage AerS_266]